MSDTYKDKIKLLVNDALGIYVPQAFSESFLYTTWGVTAEDNQILLSGPDHSLFWDTWDSVLNTAKHTDDQGVTWSLYQNGDLWAVRNDMTERDWEEWVY